ncbi:MAG: hypothetical protein WC342_05995 [Methanoregula sp.]|jgi:hypothetical protein
MGRTFPSVRQGVNGTAERWARCIRSLKIEDAPYGGEFVRIATWQSGEAFVACDDTFEVEVFPALAGILKIQDRPGGQEDHVDP